VGKEGGGDRVKVGVSGGGIDQSKNWVCGMKARVFMGDISKKGIGLSNFGKEQKRE